MKYALFGYDTDGSLERLAAEDKRALHGEHRTLYEKTEAASTASVSVIAHYRFRPARLTTTVRLAGEDIVKLEGPAAEASNGLRALYLLESDDPDAVLDLATRLPAVGMGGSVEVWQLTEPDQHERHQHPQHGAAQRH
jgi:hypothetical protein